MHQFMLAVVPLISLAFALPLFAGQPYEALDAGDVFVATITRVEDKGATNAHPPRVWLDVHEVIRGDAKTVRSPAVWSPPFHGIDWGDENVPELKQWNVRPFKGPMVGQKFILGGEVLKLAPDEKNAPVYYLFAFVRIPYSNEARTKALATLKALDEARRKYAAEQAAAEKERARRRREWRAAITDQVIDKRTQQADAVAIGKLVSGTVYEIETLLKGQPRMSSGGRYFVALPSDGYDERIADFVYERPRCILFLSEASLIASVTDIHARLVDPFEGIVPADDAAIAAVKASLAKTPPPPPKPVLVISALPREAAASVAEAAREKFTVVLSHQFSAHGPNTIVHVRNTIPHAGWLVMIDGGAERRVRAVQITRDDSATLYEAWWPEKDYGEQLQTLLKKLAGQ